MNMTTAQRRAKRTTSGRHLLNSRQYTSSFSNIDWGPRSSELSDEDYEDEQLGSHLDDSYEWRREEEENPQRQQQQQQNLNTTVTSDDDDSLLYVPLSTCAAAAAAAAEEKKRATSPAANEKHEDDQQPYLSQNNKSAAYHKMIERHSSHLSEVSVDSDGFLHWDRSTKSCERWKISGTKPSSSSSSSSSSPAVGRAASFRMSHSSRRSEVSGIDSVDDEDGFLHWDRTNKRRTSDHPSSLSAAPKQTTTSASPPPSTNNNCSENSSSTNNISETTTSTSTSEGLEVSFKSSSIMDLSSCRDEALKIIDEVLSENNKES